MWNVCDMIWRHISALYYADLDQGLHQLPKITPDHINLTSFSKISGTVALALRRFYIDGSAEETLTASMSGQPPSTRERKMFSWLHIPVPMMSVLTGYRIHF